MKALVEYNHKRISELQEAINEKMTMDFHYFMDYGSELGDRKVLMRAGAQLIIDMLDYNHEFSDIEIINLIDAAGQTAGQAVTYCTLKDSNNNTIAKGFGACRLENAFFDLNNAAKSARRNALVDAAIHIKGISCVFFPEESPVHAAFQKTGGFTNKETTELPEMSEEEEQNLLDSIMPMNEADNEETATPTAIKQTTKANTKPEPKKTSKKTESTAEAKQQMIVELHRIAPKSWIMDVPTMFETDSLENMTLDQLQTAIDMMKSSLAIKAESDKNNEEESFLV